MRCKRRRMLAVSMVAPVRGALPSLVSVAWSPAGLPGAGSARLLVFAPAVPVLLVVPPLAPSKGR